MTLPTPSPRELTDAQLAEELYIHREFVGSPAFELVKEAARRLSVPTPARWECFCDEAYYHQWAVRPVGENRWGHCFHVRTEEEAKGLVELLSKAPDLKPVSPPSQVTGAAPAGNEGGSGALEQSPKWGYETHDNEYFLLYGDVQAGMIWVSPHFPVANVRRVVEALNRHYSPSGVNAAPSGGDGKYVMSRDETIAFLEGHEDPVFQDAKELAQEIGSDTLGTKYIALRIWNVLSRQQSELRARITALETMVARKDKALKQIIDIQESGALEPSEEDWIGWRTALSLTEQGVRDRVRELEAALEKGQINCDAVYDDLREERDALRAEVESLRPKWISCEERMPEDGLIWVHRRSGSVECASVHFLQNWWPSITHWMPCPTPERPANQPKEEGK